MARVLPIGVTYAVQVQYPNGWCRYGDEFARIESAAVAVRFFARKFRLPTRLVTVWQTAGCAR